MRFLITCLLMCGFAQASLAGQQTSRKPVLFTDQILAQAKANTLSGKCTWNWECFSNEQCLNEECVPKDIFNRCNSNFDCWPGECEDGVCKDR